MNYWEMSGIEGIVPESSANKRQSLDGARSENIELEVFSNEAQISRINSGENNTGEEQKKYLEGWRLYGLVLG